MPRGLEFKGKMERLILPVASQGATRAFGREHGLASASELQCLVFSVAAVPKWGQKPGT